MGTVLSFNSCPMVELVVCHWSMHPIHCTLFCATVFHDIVDPLKPTPCCRPSPAPSVPPPPPSTAIGARTLSRGPRYASSVPLLMLNWKPLKDVTATIFSSLNDKRVIEALSFLEFENLFQAKKQTRGDRTRELSYVHQI